MPIQVRDAGTRQDTFVIRVTLNGKPMGVFDKKSGGELGSDVIVYQPGGMVPPISLGGKKTTGDLTLSRNYDRVADHDVINSWLAAVGKGHVVISQRPMDPDANEYGKSVIWNGTLKQVLVPDVDSTSTTESSFEIIVAVKGYPTSA